MQIRGARLRRVGPEDGAWLCKAGGGVFVALGGLLSVWVEMMCCSVTWGRPSEGAGAISKLFLTTA